MPPADPSAATEPYAQSATLDAVLAELRAIRERLEAAGDRPEWLDSAEAVKHARCSLKSLLRADAAGEDVGLRRIGVKLLFRRELLDRWLLAKTTATAVT